MPSEYQRLERKDERLQAQDKCVHQAQCIDRVLSTPEFDRRQVQGAWRLRKWVRDLFEDDDSERESPSAFSRGAGGAARSGGRARY